MNNPAKTASAVEKKAQHKPTFPVAPRSVEDTGLSETFLIELLTKVLFTHGKTNITEVSSYIKLPIAVIDNLLCFMRKERLCELTSRGINTSSTFYQLTEMGRARANEYIHRSKYVGPAPVNLESYAEQVEKQLLSNVRFTRELVYERFDGIVVQNGVLDRLGAAMNSERSVFIYGPAGSGKTFLAETLSRLLDDLIAIPYAIIVDNEVIQIYDPLIHEIIQEEPEEEKPLELRLERKNIKDERWMLCKRPIAASGGELTLQSFDLKFDVTTRFYQAPPHLKANNGLYIVDDLGHQVITPFELMNRWIVPLDRRRDYLTLNSGYKFRIPFDVKVIFSSNLSPETLADDAFLRRLGYKIYIGELNEEQYATVFKQVCDELAIPFSETAFDHLMRDLHAKEGRPLLACYPRDLLSQVKDYMQFENIPLQLTSEALDWAWKNYFSWKR